MNQLITFLDKGGGRDTSAGRSENTIRAVRVKREADEAGLLFSSEINPLTPTTLIPDKEYRKAVHWLETLRLRRVKTLENGYKVGYLLTPLAAPEI